MNRCWVLIYDVFGMYSKITIYLRHNSFDNFLMIIGLNFD